MRTSVTVALLVAAVLVAGCGDNGGEAGAGVRARASIGKGIEGVAALKTRITGSDDAPGVSWNKVDGATYYRVTAQGSKGEAQWSWQGTGTEVLLGAGVPVNMRAKYAPQSVTVTAWSGARPLAASARVRIPR